MRRLFFFVLHPMLLSSAHRLQVAPILLGRKRYRQRIGQENGVLGHREGTSGNRAEANPDGSRKKKK